MIDKFLLLASPRRHDLDAPARPDRERFGQHLTILDIMRQKHEARGRFVEIELRQESIEDLSRGEALVGARIIGSVAPVLECAEEEDLDAKLSGLLDCSEYIGFLDALRIDALAALNRRERRDAVAQPRCLFEFQILGR